MKKFMTALALTLFASSAIAADVVCSCDDDSCKPVEINFVPSNPGVYMNITTRDGNKVYEGYAQITTIKETRQIYYRLANFTLLFEKGEWSMPVTNRVCK
ncbi:MAG: hypothetical protein HRT44_06945 [Bdellovibrionales bacterium]|nr:hypothetical protein [Bdellovibrionales bacterium]NQZ18975.1 hypothetical protein [Bdellovibrionales bacterium]